MFRGSHGQHSLEVQRLKEELSREQELHQEAEETIFRDHFDLWKKNHELNIWRFET